MLWAAACETALWPAGTFARAYAANRRGAIEDAIDADPPTCCGPVPTAAVQGTELGGSAPADPEFPGRSPAACGGRRPPCGRSASRSPLAVRATPAAGSSESMRAPDTPSAPSASEAGLRHSSLAITQAPGWNIFSLCAPRMIATSGSDRGCGQPSGSRRPRPVFDTTLPLGSPAPARAEPLAGI
jgi:hypothetical protein